MTRRRALPCGTALLALLAGCRAGRPELRPELATVSARVAVGERIPAPVLDRRSAITTRRRAREAALERQPKVSVAFVAQDVREAVATVAKDTGTTILVYPGPQASVDLALKDVPLERALDLLLFPIDYAWARRDERTYVCGPADPELPTFRELATVRTFPTLSDPVALRAALPEKSLQPFVHAAAGRRALTIVAPETLAERIEDLLVAVDERRVTVEIDVLVIAVERTAAEQAGARRSPLTVGLKADGTITRSDVSSVAEGASTVVSWTAEVLASLEYLEQCGLAQVRASPRAVAVDGERAELQAIQELYVPIAGSLVTNPEIETIQAGVKMSVTPLLTASGDVELRIEPEVSDVVGLDPKNSLPIINRRSMKTTVRVRDGETVVLGGLRRSISRDDRTRTPGLGDVPLLGSLFSSRDRADTDTDLVLLITPRVLAR